MVVETRPGHERSPRGAGVRLLRAGAVVVATASLLAGCGAGVGAPDVTAELPRSFAGEGARGAEISADWARSFGSADLARLVERADRDNLDIAAATARVAAAEAQLAATRAEAGPQIGASGETSRAVTPGTRTAWSPPFRASVADSHRLGVSASWTIDLNGRLRALEASREASVAAARIERDAVRLTTETSVVEAYLRVGAAAERLRIAAESVATAERTLAVYRRRMEVGTATALDIAQQESLVATQRAAVPDLEIELRQSRNALVVATGRVPEAEVVRPARLWSLRVPTIAAGVPARLLTRRPDVAAVEAQLAAAAANVEAARAAFLPEVSLTGSSGLASAFLKNLMRPDAVASSVAASVTAPIFDSGARIADLEAARASHAELVATYRKTVHSALADVENALVAVEQNRRREILQQAVVKAARRAQALTEERLAEGTIDITTVLEAERTLFQAEQTLATVRLARLQAAVSLAGALGGGWSREAAAVDPAARGAALAGGQRTEGGS